MQSDGHHVARVRYKVCSEFRDQLVSLRNYCPTFVEGTENVRSSAILHPAKFAMHTQFMDLYYIKMNAPSPLEYAPIAKAFAHEKLDPAAKERVVKKFEIAFFFLQKKSSHSQSSFHYVRCTACRLEVATKTIMPLLPLLTMISWNS